MKALILSALLADLQNGRTAILATVTRGEEHEIGSQLLFRMKGEIVGENNDGALRATLQEYVQGMFGQDRNETVRIDEREFFIESYCPAPKLVIIGAVHIAIPLVTFAKELGYKTFLIDPRQAFATPQRFPHVDELISRWPDQALTEIGIDTSTYVVVLTHDPKLDDPAMKFALRHKPAYLGVLGSRKTHEKRMQRLQSEGVSEAQLRCIHAPIGIDVGGRTPTEIALSIMAEIIAVRRNRTIKTTNSTPS